MSTYHKEQINTENSLIKETKHFVIVENVAINQQGVMNGFYKDEKAILEMYKYLGMPYIGDDHPDTDLIIFSDDVAGFARNIELKYVDVEYEGKTFNIPRIYSDLYISKEDSPVMAKEVLEGKRTETSIGYNSKTKKIEGTFMGKRYYYKVSKILINDIAILPEDEIGACSNLDGCGIKMSTEVSNTEIKRLADLMDIDYINTKSSEQTEFECECIKCGHKLKTEEHCIDLKCPECGGRMRRAERPGVGQENNSPDNNGNKPQEETTMEKEKESVEKTEVKEEVKEETKPEPESKTEETPQEKIEEKTEEENCEHTAIIEAKDNIIKGLQAKLEVYEKSKKDELIKDITLIAGKTEDFKDMTLIELEKQKIMIEDVQAKINARSVEGIGSNASPKKKENYGGKYNKKTKEYEPFEGSD